MTYLRHMTNEQLKACLLGDMESLRDGGWVPDDDSIDATVSVIEECSGVLTFIQTRGSRMTAMRCPTS